MQIRKLNITKLNKKTRRILGKIHEGRIKNKKGYLRVTNYLKLNTKKKNFYKNKICGDFGCGNHAGNSKRMLVEGAKFVHFLQPVLGSGGQLKEDNYYPKILLSDVKSNSNQDFNKCLIKLL